MNTPIPVVTSLPEGFYVSTFARSEKAAIKRARATAPRAAKVLAVPETTHTGPIWYVILPTPVTR